MRDTAPPSATTFVDVPGSTKRLRIWITISHPGMAESDTIGDMVRMKMIRDVLHSMGHDATIICVHADEAGISPHEDSRGPKGRALKELLKRCVPRSFWATLKDLAYRRNNRMFKSMLESRDDSPDLVIDYNFYWSDAAIEFARQRGIAVILNMETLIGDSMPAVEHSWLRSRGQVFETDKYHRPDRVWAVSEPLAAALSKCAGIEPSRIDVIPNAAKPHATPRTQIPGIPDESLVLGFVGGFADWYALDRLVAEFLELRREFPRLFLLLVGDGPERGRIEALLRAAPRDAYLLPGTVPHADVPTYVARMDVCVVTNHTWWSSPLKLLEYGSLGKAVVAPDLPSITSMVTTDEARLFPAGNFSEFRKACADLLADDVARQRLGHALRRAVESRYSPAAMASRIGASLSRLPRC